MPGSSPGMTPKVWRSPYSSIQLSNSQAPAPVFFTGAGYAVVPSPLSGALFVPLEKSRGWSAVRRCRYPSCRTLLRKVRAPLGAPPGQACAVRAYLPAISVPGAVTSGRGRGPSRAPDPAGFPRLRPRRVQPVKAAPRIRGGRRPEASRGRGYEPRPQAPHLAPSSKRLAKTPSMNKAHP